MRTQTSKGVRRAAQLSHGMGGNKHKVADQNGLRETDPSSRKKPNKQEDQTKTDKEGVKVLHTKSQAGRTQKSGPPATRLECHSLRCTVKLRTACEKTRTGRTEKGEEKRQNTTTRCQQLEVEKVKCINMTHKNKPQTGGPRSMQTIYGVKRLPLIPPDTRPSLLCYSLGHNPTIRLQSIGKPNPGRSIQF